MFDKVMLILTFTTCALFLAIPAVNAEFPEDGVVGYWPFDDGTIQNKNVKDVLGKNDGELNGNPKSVAGKVGKGLEFNGDNSVHIPGDDSLNFAGAEAMTVAAWVNADNDLPVKGVLANCCGTIVAQRDMNSWALRFDGRNGGAEMEFIATPGWQGDGGFGAAAFPAGQWNHLVGIIDKNKMFLYLNGKLEKEAGYNGPMASNGSETEIGNAGDGGFIGIIDEVVIYNRALSANEVKNLFAAEGLPVHPQSKLATRWGQIKAAQ